MTNDEVNMRFVDDGWAVRTMAGQPKKVLLIVGLGVWMLGGVSVAGDQIGAISHGNRIEQAATPVPFASLRVHRCDECDEDEPTRDIPDALAHADHDADDARSRPFHVHGEFELGAASDGFNPDTDRIVIVLGGQVAVQEPGSLRAAGHSSRWSYEDHRNPLVTKLHLHKRHDMFWHFSLHATTSATKLYLRLGHNWGGHCT
jgi:hypothetical protein